jgi:hypothetical protein
MPCDVSCSYYVKLDPYGANALHSTWSRPSQFAHLIRSAGAYAQAQAEAESAGSDDSSSGNKTKATSPSHKRFEPKTKTIFESHDDNDDYGEIEEDDELHHAYYNKAEANSSKGHTSNEDDYEDDYEDEDAEVVDEDD